MAATKITIPRIIEILKEFIVNIIKFIANNVNPIVTKVTLNSSILSSKFSQRLSKESLLKRSCSVAFTTLQNYPWEIRRMVEMFI